MPVVPIFEYKEEIDMSKISDATKRAAAATETGSKGSGSDSKDTKSTSGKSDVKDNPTRAEVLETLEKICDRVKKVEADQADTKKTVDQHGDRISDLDKRVKALEEKSGTNTAATAAGSGAAANTVTVQIKDGYESKGYIGIDPVAVEHAGGDKPSARKLLVSGDGAILDTLTSRQLMVLGYVVKKPQ